MQTEEGAGGSRERHQGIKREHCYATVRGPALIFYVIAKAQGTSLEDTPRVRAEELGCGVKAVHEISKHGRPVSGRAASGLLVHCAVCD